MRPRGFLTRAEYEDLARIERRARWAELFAWALPSVMLGAILLGLGVLLLLAGGCAERAARGYTAQDEIRAGCASAAHAYTLATERARAGTLAPEAFASISDGYTAAVEICRGVLVGGLSPAPGDATRLADFAARTQSQVGPVR